MNQPLSLRPYLEILEELCRPLDRHALQQCILALAKQVRPEDRRVFLQNFRTVLPSNEHQEIGGSMIEESFLMNEIDSIRKEIENRLKSLEELSSVDKSEENEHPSWSANNRKMLH